MTGVPRSQGCNACRRQKKKCDQGRPSCTRCTRLRIPCVGAGEKRYKFVEVANNDKTKTSIPGGPAAPDLLPLIPTSQSTRIAGSFVHRLEVRDVRYDVSSYGSFLRQLPRRAHNNEALEAAMDAFASVFSNPCKGEDSLEKLNKYGVALKKLRMCLSTPSKAITVETLCAVYLVMLVQAWTGKRNEHIVGHEEGLSHLLDAISQQGFDGPFETEAVAVISVPLLYSSMTNDNIRLGRTLQQLMIKHRALQHSLLSTAETKEDPVKHSGFASLQLPNMGMVPEFLKEPELHRDNILRVYNLAKEDVTRLNEKLIDFRHTNDSPESPRGRSRRDHLAGCAMASALIMSMNHILQAFDPEDMTLRQESVSCTQKILKLAREASMFRPLGSGCMAGPLAISWGALDDAKLKVQIQNILKEYYDDLKGEDWVKMAKWWHFKFMKIRIRLGSPRQGDDREKAEKEVAKTVSFVQCSASHNYVEISFGPKQ